MRHRRAFDVLAAALFLALSLVHTPALLGAETPATTTASPRIERLARAGKLWGTVRYLHPWLAYKEIDWDAALVAALPKIGAAGSREEYAAAVQGLLGALGDPVTRVKQEEPPGPAPQPGDKPALFHRLDDGGLVVDFGGVEGLRIGFNELFQALEPLRREIAQASTVVVDLRAGPHPAGFLDARPYVLEELGGDLVSHPCRAPAQRYLLHSGYRPQDGTTSGGYYSGFLTLAADTFSPRAGAPATPPPTPPTPRRVVFAVDRWSQIPSIALALQACGDGRIVSQGPLSDESAVSTKEVPLGEGLTAQVRVSEIVPLPGWPGVHADVETAADAPAEALEAALRAARGETAAAAKPEPAPLPDAVFRPDKAYPEMLAPDLAWRQLAVIRAWNVIHWFYPYLHLIGDWDAVLPEFLARMDEAKTGRDYALTVMEMMTHVPDGHTTVYGHPELPKAFGEAGLPIQLRWIEGGPTVLAVGEEAKQAGIQPGDAVLSVDGEPAAARIERLARTFTASTQAALLDKICATYLLRGAAGSTAKLTLQAPGGPPREVQLARDPKYRFFSVPLSGDAVRILPGNLGYVDLPRLAPAAVDAMFETVKDTRGLIFDLRGYPQGTAWAIAPRINTRKAKIGAQFRRSQVSAFSEEEAESGFYFSQPLPENTRNLPLYTRPIVMIIDDRAISQAEHSGLFFEAASGLRFLGTPTAGANGDVTRFPLPGGLMVLFTGHDVRHADGRQLQRLGLQPDVEVAPTRQGLRDGRDELLERAVQDLEEQLGGR